MTISVKGGLFGKPITPVTGAVGHAGLHTAGKRFGDTCISGRKSGGKPVKHDKRRCRRRNRIERSRFGRLEDWRRVVTRYDRCPKVSLSALAFATMIFWT